MSAIPHKKFKVHILTIHDVHKTGILFEKKIVITTVYQYCRQRNFTITCWRPLLWSALNWLHTTEHLVKGVLFVVFRQIFIVIRTPRFAMKLAIPLAPLLFRSRFYL